MFCVCNLFLSFTTITSTYRRATLSVFFCFYALSEIRIALQITLHTIQNTIRSFYVYSVVFFELIGKFCQYLAQFQIFSINSWFLKLMHPPSSSVRVLQTKIRPSHHPTRTSYTVHITYKIADWKQDVLLEPEVWTDIRFKSTVAIHVWRCMTRQTLFCC
jgi:hypothetical protein